MSADASLNVRLFGSPRIEREGRALPLGRQKARALMAVLCAEPQPHSRDKLLALLWPLFGPEDGRNNLRRELSHLRDVLGADTLLTDRATIALDGAALAGGRLCVDVLAFDDLIARADAHGHPASQLCPACADLLTEAAALYTDPFLSGFSLPDSSAFDEWQFFHGERLRHSVATVFARLAAWHEAREEFEPGIVYGRRWLALDPLHEPAHRALLRLYERSGQHAAALRQYETLVRALHDELGVAPDPETVALYEAVKGRRLVPTPAAPLPAAPPHPHHNLPAETTLFVGRERELAAIDRLLAEPDVRLITIQGVGGIGKTRLALAAARRTVAPPSNGHLFPDGVYFAPLATLADAADIPAALALSLGFTPGRDSASPQLLLQHLNSRQALLVLDNLEHLIAPESTLLIRDILAHAPGVKLLVTSRMRLGLSGEHIFALGGLDVPAWEFSGEGELPEEWGDPVSGSAVALFVAAARRVQPSFHLDRTNLTPVIRICQLVQGMPLGIELAAVWLELLTPEAILAEIERSLDFLEATHSDAPARQTSLRAVYESSWRLLTPAEQAVLTRLTVFPGSFSRAAAEEVAGATLPTLRSLTTKSWLQPAGPERYRIHDLLRRYAARELEANPEARRVLQERHATYFASYLASLNEQMKGRQPGVAFDALTADIDNVQAALAWLIAADRFAVLVEQLLPPLYRFLESRYLYYLFSAQIQEAERRATALGLARERAILLLFRGSFFFHGYPIRFMDYPWLEPQFLDLIRQAWEPAPSDPSRIDLWSILFAWHYGRFADIQAGVERLRQLQVMCAAAGRRWVEAFAWQSLGRLLAFRIWGMPAFGQPGEARGCLEQAQAIFDVLGDERESVITLIFRGFERQSEEDWSEARRILVEAQERLRGLGEQITAAILNWQLAGIAKGLGEMDQELRHLHELAETLLQSGHPNLAIPALSNESYEAVRYGDLGTALQRRQQSLALSRASGDAYLEAWDNWELGEIYRVMDRLAEARQWYERANLVFNRGSWIAGHSFYHRGLGDVALAEGNTALAQTHFAAAADWAERSHHPWQHAYALAGLGRVALAAGQLETAQARFIQALHMSEVAGDPGIMLVVLAGMAHLCQAMGDEARAAELARLVLAHPLSWRETRATAAAVLGIGPDEAAALKGQPFELDGIIHELAGQ